MQQTHYDLMKTHTMCTETLMEFSQEFNKRVVNFLEFSQSDCIQTLTNLYKYDKSIEEIGGLNVAAHVYFHLYNYEAVPGRTYIIGDDISRLLLNTNIDVDSEMIQMPFQSIIIIPPEGMIQVYNHRTGNHPLYHIYCHMDNYNSFRELRICCVGRENSRSKGLFDDAVYYFKVKLESGKIIPQLKAQMKLWKKAIGNEQLIQSTLEEIEITESLFQYVINTILYLTSAEAEIREVTSIRAALLKRLQGIKNKTKQRKLQKQINRLPRERQFLVGGSVHLEEDDRSAMDKRHGKLGVQFWVTGHWRSQPYGPQNSLRRNQWIKPFKKGRSLGELIHSVGIVK